jgi:hypothetical protein
MIEDYKEYFGVDTAPTNFDRLLFIAGEQFKNVITQPIPTVDDACFENYNKALFEQINYLDENPELLSFSGNGNTLGKFKEGTSQAQMKINDNRLSPTAYSILLNCNLLYVGVC